MFQYIPTEDLENDCSQTMNGTMKIHQIFTNLLTDQKILHRQILCLWKHCLNNQ